jgi:hypothetical protein
MSKFIYVLGHCNEDPDPISLYKVYPDGSYDTWVGAIIKWSHHEGTFGWQKNGPTFEANYWTEEITEEEAFLEIL